MTGPSRWWFAVSGASIAASAILGLVGLFLFVQSFDVDGEFRADGQPHIVTTPVDRERMLYVREGQDVPRCTVEGVVPERVRGDYTYTTNGVTWVAFAVFDSPGRVEVVCRAERSDVRVAASLGASNTFRAILFFAVLPALLFIAGIMGIIVTSLLRAGRRTP